MERRGLPGVRRSGRFRIGGLGAVDVCAALVQPGTGAASSELSDGRDVIVALAPVLSR